MVRLYGPSPYKIVLVHGGPGAIGSLKGFAKEEFYQKQGAILSKIDMYAYYSEPKIRNEVQFVWYLDI